MDKKPKQKKAITSIPSLGVVEFWQSLFLMPSKYIDFSTPVSDFSTISFDRKEALIKAKVVQKRCYSRSRIPVPEDNAEIIILTLSDGKRSYECEIFNVREWKSVQVGNGITAMVSLKQNSFIGKHFTTPHRVQITTIPQVEYLGIAGKVSGSCIKKLISTACNKDSVFEQASNWIISQRPVLHKLIDKHWGTAESLLRSLHRPTSMKEGISALAFAKRLCVAEVRYNGRRSAVRSETISSLPNLRRETWEALRTQPETPSSGQLSALSVAIPALCGDRPARILLNGDVGSGKTLVFLSIAAGFARLNKFVSIMAPNESVAKQIFRQFQLRYPNIEAQYVAGGKKQINSEALVYIGTTALIHLKNRPEFALTIVDEQHKFSREQRDALLSPGTHLIEATATPIPRSLAIALYDGCVLAQIPTPPVSRKIRSHILYGEQRAQVRAMHRDAIESGKRVIYLYSAVKEKNKTSLDENDDEVFISTDSKTRLKTTNETFEDMQKAFPDKVCMVHGQMSPEQAASQLESFRDGSRPILIASTAIEVGVDVQGVVLLVVRNPERFGTSQLHQLRGRLARDGGDADFVMYSESELSKDSLERLNAVRQIPDGFALAERDLEIRGFGDVAGDLQSGATDTTFKLSQIGAADFLKCVR
jgi:ATP-dependent DNA helicase RecG